MEFKERILWQEVTHFITCKKCGNNEEYNKFDPKLDGLISNGLTIESYMMICPKCKKGFYYIRSIKEALY